MLGKKLPDPLARVQWSCVPDSFSRNPAGSLANRGVRFERKPHTQPIVWSSGFYRTPTRTPKICRQFADTTDMSVDGIASLSTAMSQAQLQSAVAMKVLKLAQGSEQQLAADLLNAALENVQASMQQCTQNLGANLDTLA